MNEFNLPGPVKHADKEVMVMQVIRTTNGLRGLGTPENPLRRLTQYWSMDGDLLCEVDPLANYAPISDCVRDKS